MTDQQFALIQDYKMTFGSPEGLRVLVDLKKLSGLDISIIPTGNDGHTDVYGVMRQQGHRDVITHILRKIATDLSKNDEINTISQEKL